MKLKLSTAVAVRQETGICIGEEGIVEDRGEKVEGVGREKVLLMF